MQREGRRRGDAMMITTPVGLFYNVLFLSSFR